MIFCNSFESNKDFIEFGFLFKWIQLDVFSEMINEDNIVFKVIGW
jgi:hypothetical protein